MKDTALCKVFLFFSLELLSGMVTAQSESVLRGAKVFQSYCTLCHGPQGMGEGPLANMIADYPNVSLLSARKFVEREDIKRVINEGSLLPNVSRYMPPWKDQLDKEQVKDVSEFVIYLVANKQNAADLLRQESNLITADIKKGKVLYQNYCARCHGKEGKGDGKMKKIVNQPPPFDLTKSTVNEQYVMLIITRGGQFLGRSYQMPPWKDELSEQEILSVTKFIMTLRE